MRIGEREPQDAELTPRDYVWRTAVALWDNLPQIALGGLLFSLLCVPAFVLFVLGWITPAIVVGALTVAPAWSALLALDAALLRREKLSWRAWLRDGIRLGARSVRLGVLIALPLSLLRVALAWLAAPQPPLAAWIAFAVAGLVTLVLYTFSLYAFPLLVLFDTDPVTALRNGAILAGRYVTNSLGLLSMGILGGFAVLYVSLAFLFILPAIYSMFIMNNCRLVLSLEGIEP